MAAKSKLIHRPPPPPQKKNPPGLAASQMLKFLIRIKIPKGLMIKSKELTIKGFLLFFFFF